MRRIERWMGWTARRGGLMLALAALLATAWTTTAWAGEVSGRVVDDEGRPLSGANVVLEDPATGQQRYGTATGPEGGYVLAGVRTGTYRLHVTFLGFAPYSREVAVPSAGAVTVDVTLASRAVPGAEVVVTGTRARTQLTPITFSNLSARELEVLPDMKDIPVLLATLPSITYSSENGNGIGYTSLRMRGFDQRRVAVAINGIPQNDPEEHNVFWINFFDIQGAIRDIQVQRGAASAFYGPTAIGGAINIVADPYRPYPYAELAVGYGDYATRRLSAEANSGLLADRYVVFGRFSRLLTDGYRDWSWSAFYRFFAGVTRYGERSTLTLQAYGGPQRDGLAYVGIPKAANEREVDDGFGGTIDRTYNYSAFSEDVEHFHQPHVELLHDLRLAPGVQLHQALFWIKGEGYFDFGGTFRSADYLRLPSGWRDLSAADRQQPLYLVAPDVNVLFRAYLDQWQVGWLPRLTFAHGTGETTVGAEARLHRSLRWGRVQEGSGVPAGVVGSEADARVYQFHGEKAVASLFGSHLFRPVDRLAVQGDLQLTYRHYRIYDEQFFGTSFRVPYLFVNPRLGVTLNPERPLSAYASIAYAQREPRMKSLYDGEEAGAGFEPQFERGPDDALDFDAPIVKPERLVDLEAGGAWAAERFRLAANVFLMDFRDEIVPSGELDQYGVPRTGNADRTRHVGLEVEGRARLVPGLDVYANATLSRNRFVEFTEYVTLPDFSTAPVERDGNPIAGFPEQVANVGLTLNRSGLTASVDAKFAGKQYVDNSGGELLDGTASDGLVVDPYTLLNASVEYAFPARSPLNGLAFWVDVNNVLDEEVLLYGTMAFDGPQFFPAATRHLFAGMRYTLR